MGDNHHGAERLEYARFCFDPRMPAIHGQYAGLPDPLLLSGNVDFVLVYCVHCVTEMHKFVSTL